MVAETVGTSGRDLPAFALSESAYTVYANCSGKAEVSIVDRDGQGKPRPIACDGTRTVGVIHTDETPQRPAVQVTGGPSRWKVAVILGSQQL